MATDVFISYAREDRSIAEGLANAIEGAGLEVWWDRELLGGEQFVDVIAQQLETAAFVVVVWSANSAPSKWVRAEAARADARNVIVPVQIDATDPPLPFGQLHTIDLIGWDGRDPHPGVDELIETLRARHKLTPLSPKPTARADPERTRRNVFMAGGVVGALLLGGFVAWVASRPSDDPEAHQTIVVPAPTDVTTSSPTSSADTSTRPPSTPPTTPAITPAIVSTSEFDIPLEAGELHALTVAPSGDVWFAASEAIGRLDSGGEVELFPLPTGVTGGRGITVGPDGNIWFTDPGTPSIGRITLDGMLERFPLPTRTSNPAGRRGATSWPEEIIVGGDRALWFTEALADQIGRITTDGAITEFPLPDMTIHSAPSGIASGPDNAIWFVEQLSEKLARLDLPTKEIVEFDLPASIGGLATLGPIALGPDQGAFWFPGPEIDEVTRRTIDRGSIDNSSAFSQFTTPAAAEFGSPDGIVLAGDGHLWTPRGESKDLLSISVDGAVSAHALPVTADIESIAAGPNRTLWLTEPDASKIAMITL